MAISASTVWEIRSSGSDTNGGGFVVGASGTDYSQQDSAQYALTGIATSGTSATFLSASAAADMVGNILQVVSGTNFTTGFFQVVSVSVGVSVTVDRNICTGIGASGVINIGGSIATFAKLAAAMVTGNWAFIKKTSGYTTASTITFAQGAVSWPTDPMRLIGYETTRGDAGRPTLTMTATSITGIVLSNAGWRIENIIIDGDNQAATAGIYSTADWITIRNCKVTNCPYNGIDVSGTHCLITNNEVGNGGYAIVGRQVHYNYVHGCRIAIILIEVGSACFNLLVDSSEIGIEVRYYGATILNNTIYDSATKALSIFRALGCVVRNNIFANSGTYGFSADSSSPATPEIDGNAYFNNTSGHRNGIDNTSGINAVVPYTNIIDVVITDGSPFTNAAGGDFTLNNTSLRGALLRGTATPGMIPGQSQVGYLDFGCFQHQDSGGGSSGARLVGPSALVTPGGAI